ncbi:hypothetical protein ABZZ20_25235 [Streptomyces sp. NPDC006430]|uniref:hypothetical protein n=1 Tax=Streptomyces sp. NPDC006430 TaxID=3154299 RepID=UPI0033B0E700
MSSTAITRRRTATVLADLATAALLGTGTANASIISPDALRIASYENSLKTEAAAVTARGKLSRGWWDPTSSVKQKISDVTVTKLRVGCGSVSPRRTWRCGTV